MKNKTAGHTPGPWEIGHCEDGILEGVNFVRSGSKYICNLVVLGPEGFANARLIAAAPELLKAAKGLLEAPGFNAQSFGGAVQVAALIKAIAKAEGRDA